MCGIAGIVSNTVEPDAEGSIARMIRTLGHRGPDGDGMWALPNPSRTLVFGHARLAIIDLSEAGRQPMASKCGRYVITYNGEIYNFVELREELRGLGSSFTTQTDTEVLLESLRVWGTDALARLNGMWALAWIDLQTGAVLLARDRLGVKPLHYIEDSRTVWFASEVKALLEGRRQKHRVNATAVVRYLEQSLLDNDASTFFDGITQLPAAHYAVLRCEPERAIAVRPVRYWTPARCAQPLPVAASIEQVREILQSAVSLRLRADVPCGVLLSGGIDSSAIAAVMARTSTAQDVKILSAVSDDPQYDESPHIDRVAAHLRLPVTKVELSFPAERIWELFDQATWHNDAPLLSFSSLAHLQLMEQAKKLGITVILSGQGADELFCGYRKYVGFYARALNRDRRYVSTASMLSGFAANRTVLNQFRLSEAKRYLPSWAKPIQPSILGDALLNAAVPVPMGLGSGTLRDRQERDLTELSVPVLLHYEDRMSMAHGREIRLPFLDYRMVDSVLPFREELKLHDGWTKWVLRKAIEPWLPTETVWRRDKQGFINPQNDWLRSLLRSGIETMLARPMLAASSGLIKQDVLRERYRQYLAYGDSRRVSFRDVFGAVALEIWMRRFESHLV